MWKKDKIDEICLKVSIYVVISITIIYALSRIIYSMPDILKSIGVFLSGTFLIVKPLIIGLVLAYLISPFTDKIRKIMFVKTKSKSEKFERRKDILSVIVAYILIIFILFVVVYSMYMIVSKKLMGSNILDDPLEVATQYIQKYEDSIKTILGKIQGLEISEDFKIQLESIVSSLSKIVTNLLNGSIDFITNFSKNTVSFLIGLIISFYVIIDRKYFKKLWEEILLLLMPKKYGTRTQSLFSEIDLIFSRFIRGQLLDCFIVAILSTIVLYLVGIEFSVVLGIFAGITNIIPYFGPVIGMIASGIIGALSEKPITGLFAVIALAIVQQIDANILSPRIVGGSVGIHPVFVIISVIIGGAVWGILGMIVAVPCAAVVGLLFNKILQHRLEQ